MKQKDFAVSTKYLNELEQKMTQHFQAIEKEHCDEVKGFLRFQLNLNELEQKRMRHFQAIDDPLMKSYYVFSTKNEILFLFYNF